MDIILPNSEKIKKDNDSPDCARKSPTPLIELCVLIEGVFAVLLFAVSHCRAAQQSENRLLNRLPAGALQDALSRRSARAVEDHAANANAYKCREME